MTLILCATDGSPSAKKALAVACDLAKCKGAKLLILHVQRRHGGEATPDELQFYAKVEHMALSEATAFPAEAQRIASAAHAAAHEAGVDQVESLVVEGDPTRRISEIAKDRGADAVVVGSRGRSEVAGLLLGSVSHKVSQLVPCTCIIVR